MPSGPARPSNATRFLPACAEFHGPCSPEVVLDGVTTPLLMRSLSDGLYFRSADDIVRVTPDGERSVVRTAPGLIYFEIQTDGTLYYATSTPAALHRGALAEPASDEVLVSDSSEQYAFLGFAVTPTEVWQGADVGLLRLPFDGGAVSPLRDALCVDVVWDGTRVHCRTGFSVLTIDPATLSVTVRDERNVSYADVELTSRWLYWAPYGDDVSVPTMELSRASTEPGGDVEVVSLPAHPSTFAPDEGGVYFSALQSIEGHPVYYLADDSVTPIPVVVDTEGNGANGGAGIDATHVYWSHAPDQFPEEGTIWRAPRCGCP